MENVLRLPLYVRFLQASPTPLPEVLVNPFLSLFSKKTQFSLNSLGAVLPLLAPGWCEEFQGHQCEKLLYHRVTCSVAGRRSDTDGVPAVCQSHRYVLQSTPSVWTSYNPAQCWAHFAGERNWDSNSDVNPTVQTSRFIIHPKGSNENGCISFLYFKITHKFLFFFFVFLTRRVSTSKAKHHSLFSVSSFCPLNRQALVTSQLALGNEALMSHDIGRGSFKSIWRHQNVKFLRVGTWVSFVRHCISSTYKRVCPNKCFKNERTNLWIPKCRIAVFK